MDAADAGRETHRRRGLPDRRPARRRGPDHHGRGAGPGHRRPARPADVPPVRRGRAGPADRPGDERVPRRRRRAGRLRLAAGGSARRRRCPGHPGPPGDQPRRHRRHDRRTGYSDLPRREDLPCRGGRPRHGPDLRVRRRGDRRRHPPAAGGRAGRPRRPRGGRALDRRLVRRGLPRRGAGGALAGRRVLRGEAARGRLRPAGRRRPPDHDPRGRRRPARSARQCRHRAGCRACPPVRGRRYRAVPDRAHVPRRAPEAGRTAHPRRR